MDPSPTLAYWKSRVRYGECDRFGIAHHSSYVPWFESGRLELLRLLGHSYDQLEQDGFAYPLVQISFRYLAPLRLEEVFKVETAVLSVTPLRLTFACRIFVEERRSALAFSVHALVDRNLKVREIPQDFRDFLTPRLAPENYLGRRFGPRQR
jgi:acyl-CoA thioester hydrolase